MVKAVYTYHIDSKPINFTTTTVRDIEQKLGISLPTIQVLVHDPNKKNLFSRFITITREKMNDL